MAAITKPAVRRPSRLTALPLTAILFGLIEVLSVYRFGQLAGWWLVAVAVVVLVELRGLRRAADKTARMKLLWDRTPGIIMGISVALIIATAPRLATQVVVALLYGGWLVWRELRPAEDSLSLVQLLLVQAVAFEAIFLVAAIWQTPDGQSLPAWIILVAVWLTAYFGVYATFTRRGDRSAGVLAATWGVVAAEIAWVLMLWLITYTLHGGYVLVPQPALILTALAYVFGSVLAASRQGSLSRVRLGEYMVIALVLVVIVVAGTSWHGNG